jgi:hypothetical protein
MGLEALLAQQIIGLSEAIDDEVASLLVAGTGISLSYNDGAGTLTIANTGLGGSTGSTDNRILRADGTGGATVQNSAVTIDDSGNISGLGLITSTRAGAMGSTNPQNQIVVYGGFAGYGVGFDANGELSTVVNSVLKSTLGTNLRLSSNGSIQFNSATNLSGSNDVQILRNATGPSAEIRAAGGLRVRNADGSNWQTVNALDGIFSNDVYVGVNRYIGGNGVVGWQFLTSRIVSTGMVSVGTYTVATLPSAAANAGALAQVTDSSVTTNGSTVAGGGSNRVIVFCNGTTWDVVVA